MEIAKLFTCACQAHCARTRRCEYCVARRVNGYDSFNSNWTWVRSEDEHIRYYVEVEMKHFQAYDFRLFGNLLPSLASIGRRHIHSETSCSGGKECCARRLQGVDAEISLPGAQESVQGLLRHCFHPLGCVLRIFGFHSQPGQKSHRRESEWIESKSAVSISCNLLRHCFHPLGCVLRISGFNSQPGLKSHRRESEWIEMPWPAALDYAVEDPWREQPDRGGPTDSRLGLNPVSLLVRPVRKTHPGALRTTPIHYELYDTSHCPADE
ncbi:hypothetical protein AVEN_251765-1 [Araneus ventricosus]|uniref:Uncharacterized protein n=1 Tax=Araneus ventricosus TaxID=182803 RepID=A0A4Y2BTI2_ARAVE|nr:hypothetical protein AVEN_251765-1 [Araneus ventricosus]